ncbi:hypothetical protein LIER_00504 [Lithospermum erythrorhizon]|uniref:Uncharacterized protein n=1 Tax=Lithospermum erythrorhizon TaxID=34254 RepID=A0AAV3NIQ1_LITER
MEDFEGQLGNQYEDNNSANVEEEEDEEDSENLAQSLQNTPPTIMAQDITAQNPTKGNEKIDNALPIIPYEEEPVSLIVLIPF